MGMVGARYRYGGTDPNEGFDCSGLAFYAYTQAGYRIPRTSQEQFRAARKIALSEADAGRSRVLPGSREALARRHLSRRRTFRACTRERPEGRGREHELRLLPAAPRSRRPVAAAGALIARPTPPRVRCSFRPRRERSLRRQGRALARGRLARDVRVAAQTEPLLVAACRRELIEPRASAKQRVLGRRELGRLYAIRAGSVLDRERQVARGPVLLAEHGFHIGAEFARAECDPADRPPSLRPRKQRVAARPSAKTARKAGISGAYRGQSGTRAIIRGAIPPSARYLWP